MKRRRIKHETSFEERLANQVRQFGEQAKPLPPGEERDELIRKARQAETASLVNEWRSSPDCSRQRSFSPRGTAMRDYRAYVIGPDGHVMDRFDFWCADDETAKEHAKQYVDGHDIELWHRDKKIAALRA